MAIGAIGTSFRSRRAMGRASPASPPVLLRTRLSAARGQLLAALLVAAVVVAYGWLLSSAACAYIYWTKAESSGIERANLDGSGVIQDFTPTLAASGAVAATGGYVYWTNPQTGAIGRATMRGEDLNQRFITVEGAHPNAIAIAVGGGRIYWSWRTFIGTDPASIVTGLGRANIDGSGVEQNFIRIGTGLASDLGGAVAVGGPYLFWVKSTDSVLFAPQVMRATLDGQAVTKFVDSRGRYPSFPNRIASNARYLYFNDDMAIGRIDINGGDIADFGFPRLGGLGAIALDSAHLYWSGSSSDGIDRGDFSGSVLENNFIPPPAGGVAWLAVDAYGPVAVDHLSVSPRRFPAAPKAQGGAHRYGTLVNFTLDKSEEIRFTVVKVLPGRTQKGHCVALTTRRRDAKPCTRVISLPGSFTRSGATGKNRFRFTGRLASRRLRPGNYRLTATPSADGTTGSPSTTRFQITR